MSWARAGAWVSKSSGKAFWVSVVFIYCPAVERVDAKIVRVSEIFRKVIEAGVRGVMLTAGEAEFIQGLRYSRGVYSDLAELVKQDPVLEFNLLQAVNRLAAEKVEKGEPVSSVPTALSFIGFQPARNFLAASIVARQRQASMGLSPNSAEEKEALRFALLGESQAQESFPYPHDSFVAGLIFDLVRSQAEGTGPAAAALESALLGIWKESRAAAELAVSLASRFSYSEGFLKDLCLDAMLHGVGRAVLAVHEASIGKLEEDFGKRRDPRVEEEKFRFAHPVYGYCFLGGLDSLRMTRGVILFQFEPFLAARLGETGLARATLLWLVGQVTQYRGAGKSKVPVKDRVESWYHCCSAALTVKPDLFAAAIQNLGIN